MKSLVYMGFLARHDLKLEISIYLSDGKQAKLMVGKQQRESLARPQRALLACKTWQNVHISELQSSILPPTSSTVDSNYIAAMSSPVMSLFLRTGAQNFTLLVITTERERSGPVTNCTGSLSPFRLPVMGLRTLYLVLWVHCILTAR